MNSILRLIVHIIICLVIGSSGAYFTAQSLDSWYPSLVKPFFNPPNFIFAPVWTTLFILLAFSLWGILKTKYPEKKKALILFILQFVFNIAWSFSFFGLRNPTLAFIDILLLIITVFLFIKETYKIRKWIAYSQIPYLLWITFAAILNASIIYLN